MCGATRLGDQLELSSVLPYRAVPPPRAARPRVLVSKLHAWVQVRTQIACARRPRYTVPQALHNLVPDPELTPSCRTELRKGHDYFQLFPLHPFPYGQALSSAHLSHSHKRSCILCRQLSFPPGSSCLRDRSLHPHPHPQDPRTLGSYSDPLPLFSTLSFTTIIISTSLRPSWDHILLQA